MKNDIVKQNEVSQQETIVIPDECGDTLWDAVLNQELVKAAEQNNDYGNALLNKINAVQVCDANEA